jgi:DNA-binding CsgD family transcriptional regulator
MAIAIVALIVGAFVVHTIHHYVVAPLGHGTWDIVDAVLILAVLLSFCYFVLHVFTELTHHATGRRRTREELAKAGEESEAKAERQVHRRNPYGLTLRELVALHLVAAGTPDKEIATLLLISVRTAHKHVENILSKMVASSRTEASVRAVREGWLE